MRVCGHGWRPLAAMVLLAGLGGCSTVSLDNPPGIYRIDVQQGNVVTREMLDRIEPGMDQRRVRLLLGTPLIVDPFNQNRWDYVYQFTKGRGDPVQRRIQLYFVQGRLDRITGDVDEVPREHAEGDAREQVVTVPQREEKGGLLRALTPGFLRHDAPAEPAKTAEAPAATPSTGQSAPDADAAAGAPEANAPAQAESEPPSGEQGEAAVPEPERSAEDTGFLQRLFSGFRSSGDGSPSAEEPAADAAAAQPAAGNAESEPGTAPAAGEDTAEEATEGSSAAAQPEEDSGFLRRLLDRIRGAEASTGNEGEPKADAAEGATALQPPAGAATAADSASEATPEPATESEDDGFFSRLLKRFRHDEPAEAPASGSQQPASE